MNNYPSFLDSGNGPMNTAGIPRQPPPPGSSVHSGQANGASSGVGGGGGGMPSLVNGLLSGGHQTDMNHLWQVVQQLSEVLAENRSQTANIMNQVQQIQTRGPSDTTDPSGAPTPSSANGDLPSAAARSLQQQAAEQHHLRTQVAHLQASLSASDAQNAALRALLTDYETSLAHILDKLRPFAYKHAEALLALHAHYNGLLDRERRQNLELRLEHQEWQAGLGRVAGLARQALKEGAEGALGYETRVRELRAENRVLRRLAGWEVGSDSEGEEDGEEVQIH